MSETESKNINEVSSTNVTNNRAPLVGSPWKSSIQLDGDVFKLPNPYYKANQALRKKLASCRRAPIPSRSDKTATPGLLPPRSHRLPKSSPPSSSSPSLSSIETFSTRTAFKKGDQECIKNPFASPASPKIPIDELTLMYLKIVERRDLGLSTPIGIGENDPESFAEDLSVDFNDEQFKEVGYLCLLSNK